VTRKTAPNSHYAVVTGTGTTWQKWINKAQEQPTLAACCKSADDATRFAVRWVAINDGPTKRLSTLTLDIDRAAPPVLGPVLVALYYGRTRYAASGRGKTLPAAIRALLKQLGPKSEFHTPERVQFIKDLQAAMERHAARNPVKPGRRRS
jgi:hypothetical protein